ncbi:MAG: flagellar assembly protein FliH [Xanthobacteraceae bacterium]|nr:flagellar assembly protein FliH [Xanthobacteraceae bacterium]
MAPKAKFMFEQNFAPGASQAEKAVAAAEHALKLADAEQQGFRNGFEAAEHEGHSVAARRTAAAFEQMAASVERFSRTIVAAEQRIEAEAIELAVAIARKLVPELLQREPFGEIAALATECFRQLSTAPHVVVRVNDALHETAQKQLEEIARTRGFDGRLVVVAEPEIAVGDCKIEWADGGIIRDMAQMEETIGTTIARYLGARPSAVLPELGEIA